jgi:ribosomal protein S18 acetylase RimI-like enzyme
MTVKFEEREMTKAEHKREKVAFDEFGLQFGNPPDPQERFGFVATDDGKLVGASSGLAQKYPDHYGKYFYLTDLLVEKEYRKKGIGKNLLYLLEEKVKKLGVKFVWTWTAEYEGLSFYQKQGYKVFNTQENYYPSGHSRVGLIKQL